VKLLVQCGYWIRVDEMDGTKMARYYFVSLQGRIGRTGWTVYKVCANGKKKKHNELWASANLWNGIGTVFFFSLSVIGVCFTFFFHSSLKFFRLAGISRCLLISTSTRYSFQ
jgi:hypothetical protein